MTRSLQIPLARGGGGVGRGKLLITLLSANSGKMKSTERVWCQLLGITIKNNAKRLGHGSKPFTRLNTLHSSIIHAKALKLDFHLSGESLQFTNFSQAKWRSTKLSMDARTIKKGDVLVKSEEFETPIRPTGVHTNPPRNGAFLKRSLNRRKRWRCVLVSGRKTF